MRERLIELLEAEKGFSRYMTDDERRAKLADYLLAEGVIVPKVKIGDKLYELSASKTKLYECTVTYFEVDENDIAICGTKPPWQEERWICNQSELGNHEWVYLTREEAEKALAERSKG